MTASDVPSSLPAPFEEETSTAVGTPRSSRSTSDRGAPSAQLVVLDGDRVGRRCLLGENPVVLGRSHQADFQLADSQVSRRHAVIRRVQGKRYVIEDLGSRNGTFVNGRRIRRRRTLQPGDRIQLGSRVLLLFELRDPAEDEALHRQRLEALGRIGAGIAHDFNNLLGAIQSSAQLLLGLPAERTLGSDEVQECLRDIQLAAERASHLTHRILGFARRRPAEQRVLDLAALCDEVVSLAHRICPRSIRIRWQRPEPIYVLGDWNQLHQVLMNLCVNARDAMPSGGTLALQLRRARPEELERATLTEVDGGMERSYVALLVRDTGVGMDEATRRRAFDPFFSTKPNQRGLGLGLASAYQTVRQHGGGMYIDSAPGSGTTVTVVLPVHDADANTGRTPRLTERAHERAEQGPSGSAGRTPAPSHAPRALRRVGVVDDDPLVRRSLGRLLRRAGYLVEEFDGGAPLLQALRRGLRPDAIVMDLDMPGMTGEQAFGELRRLAPEIPVVFVTGVVDADREKLLIEHGAKDVLLKPYDADRLLALLREALGGGAPEAERRRAPRPPSPGGSSRGG